MSDELGVDFESVLAEELQDKTFREEYERLAPAYEVAKLRMERGLTQQQLAERVGTRQSGISRLESGSRDPSLSFLRRVARALGARVEVRLVKLAESSAPDMAPEDDRAIGLEIARAPSSQAAEEPSKYVVEDEND